MGRGGGVKALAALPVGGGPGAVRVPIAALGYERKPEGLCKGPICHPIPDGGVVRITSYNVCYTKLLRPAPIAVLEGNFPSVGASGGSFLVVASKLTSGDVRTLYGKRVDAAGAVLDGSPIFVGVNYATASTCSGSP